MRKCASKIENKTYCYKANRNEIEGPCKSQSNRFYIYKENRIGSIGTYLLTEDTVK